MPYKKFQANPTNLAKLICACNGVGLQPGSSSCTTCFRPRGPRKYNFTCSLEHQADPFVFLWDEKCNLSFKQNEMSHCFETC